MMALDSLEQLLFTTQRDEKGKVSGPRNTCRENVNVKLTVYVNCHYGR